MTTTQVVAAQIYVGTATRGERVCPADMSPSEGQCHMELVTGSQNIYSVSLGIQTRKTCHLMNVSHGLSVIFTAQGQLYFRGVSIPQ
jgi:hypothetical protein